MSVASKLGGLELPTSAPSISAIPASRQFEIPIPTHAPLVSDRTSAHHASEVPLMSVFPVDTSQTDVLEATTTNYDPGLVRAETTIWTPPERVVTNPLNSYDADSFREEFYRSEEAKPDE